MPDVTWLLTHGVQLALLKCLKSSEYQGILGHALGRVVDFGMQAGLEAGHKHGSAGRSLSVVDAYNPKAAKANYIDAVKALEDVDFPLVNLLKSKKDAGMNEVLDCFLLDGPIADLSEATWMGEASTSAAPLSVEDYQEEDTDEALGSVVAIPQLEAPYL
ncbi:hypothetical protein Tco_1325746 [Tanacetum coccineum]